MPDRKSNLGHMPRGVQRRIIERSAHNQVVVVVSHKGKPTRVFELDRYLKMREQPRKHKPWLSRKPRTDSPEPLGAIEGNVLGSLRREKIYE